MLLAHKIELRPTPEQATYLLKCIGANRFSYNALLAYFQQGGVKWSKQAAYAYYKAEVRQPWMDEVTSRAPRQAIDALGAAFSKFFENVKLGRRRGKKNPFGFPQFHKRGIHDSFTMRDCDRINKHRQLERGKFYVRGRKLRIEKAPGLILMRQKLRFAVSDTTKIRSVTVSYRAGKFFASILVDTENYETRFPTREPSVVGVDFGLKELAVLSCSGDHQHFPANQKLKASLRRLRRLQRNLSRKTKGSNRREQAKRKVARLHMRVTNQRRAVQHELSDFLTKAYQHLVIEDLAVGNMVKNRRLARAISDAGWYELRRQIEYKANLRGNTVTIAPRFYPSSRKCNACKTVKSDLKLDDRTYHCSACGHVQDRDEHAADNLEDYGLHTFAADLKRASEIGETDEARPRRTVDKDRCEEA